MAACGGRAQRGRGKVGRKRGICHHLVKVACRLGHLSLLVRPPAIDGLALLFALQPGGLCLLQAELTELPPNLTSWQTTRGTTPRWSTIPIARPGRPRERIFSSVLPDAHAGAASYHVFGQCSPTPGLMPQVVWHAREITFRSHIERERERER